jgi:inhibitor of KinA
MIGFIPGFPYMGTLPEQLEVPRKQTPSLKIPIGSVAIAGKQTGIYSAEVPGGWQVIGRTPLKMFDPFASPCSFLNAGDRVQFNPITLDAFNQFS